MIRNRDNNLDKVAPWPEFSTKVLLDPNNGFFTTQEFKDYHFTTDPKKVDRQYVWNLYCALHEKESKEYYQYVYDSKMLKRLPVKKDTQCVMDDHWLDKLLEFE